MLHVESYPACAAADRLHGWAYYVGEGIGERTRVKYK